jgi:hypothetical protein
MPANDATLEGKKITNRLTNKIHNNKPPKTHGYLLVPS